MHEPIEHGDFSRGQREVRRCLWGRPIEHRHPEDPPAQDAEDRDQIGQTLGGPKLRFLGFAARFEDLVEHLDLPSQSIPSELFDGVRAGADGQIGDQLPFDLLSVLRRPALLGTVTVNVRAG